MELRFGEYGGQYVSEVLMPSLKELEKAYKEYKDDPEFKEELDYYLKNMLEEKHHYTLLKILQKRLVELRYI